MPTIMRIGGLRVAIYPNDHRPPDVHVIGPNGEAVFYLNAPDGPPSLRSSKGFTMAELNRIASALMADIENLIAHWNRFHGNH